MHHEHEQLGGIIRGEASLTVKASGHRGVHLLRGSLILTRDGADRVLRLLLIVSLISRVIDTFPIESKHIWITLNGIFILGNVNSRDLVGMARGTVMAIDGPPRVIGDDTAISVGTDGALVFGGTRDARGRDKQGEFLATFGGQTLINRRSIGRGINDIIGVIRAHETLFKMVIHHR